MILLFFGKHDTDVCQASWNICNFLTPLFKHLSFEKLPSMKPKGRRKLTSVTFKTLISIVVMLCDAQGRSCSCVNRLQYPVSSASWRLSINLWSRTIQTRVLWTLPVAGKSSIPDLGNYLLVPVADFHFSSPRTLCTLRPWQTKSSALIYDPTGRALSKAEEISKQDR